MSEIHALIRQAEQWREQHRQRGTQGQVEVLACNIRIKALRDAAAAIRKETP